MGGLKGRDRKVETVISYFEITTPSYRVVEDLVIQIFYDPIRGRGYFKVRNNGKEIGVEEGGEYHP